MPQVIYGKKPPNFEAIAKVFPLAHRPGTIFAYGDSIYVSGWVELTPELMAHETVHCRRQKEHPGGLDGWWQQYLEDAAFRYNEELLAHRAELANLLERAPSRPARRHAQRNVAGRLTNRLYKFNVTLAQAMKDLAA